MDPNSNAPKAANPDKWKPGKYKAKAIDWGVTKTSAGLPQVSVLFEYQQPGDMPGVQEVRQLIWFGSFKEKAAERSMEVLEMLGLKQAPYPAMEIGREGKALDETIEVEVVVEHRVDLKGVRRAGIAWVNRLGGRGIDSRLEQGEGAQVFAPVNDAYLNYLRSKGVQPQQPKQTIADQIHAPKAQGTLGDDDIPF